MSLRYDQMTSFINTVLAASAGKTASEVVEDIYEVYRHFIEDAQYKPHEVDQIIMEDFNKIFATKKRKKKASKVAKSGALSPEQMMAML